MPSYALLIEYDGAPFVGWQRQDTGLSVQQVLEEAAARLNGGNFLLVVREELSRERWQWLAEALADAVATPIRRPTVASVLPAPGGPPAAEVLRLAASLDQVSPHVLASSIVTAASLRGLDLFQ